MQSSHICNSGCQKAGVDVGYCPHPVTVYDRSNVAFRRHTYMYIYIYVCVCVLVMVVVQLLLGGAVPKIDGTKRN